MVFDIFSIIIFLTVFTLSMLVIKACFGIYLIKKKGQESFMRLLLNYEHEISKSKFIEGRIVLSDNFLQILIHRVFKINKELLLIQKLIFDK